MKSRHSTARAILPFCLALVVGVPATLPAAEIQIKSDTLLRGMERNIGGNEDQKVVPGYEYLQIDGGQLTEKGFSFHGYGWGRYDFADNNYFEDNGDGELLYGYFQYVDPAQGLDFRAGRQNIFSGVGSDAIDGVQIQGAMGQGLSVNLYGGQPVGYASTEGRTGDSIYGGRLGLQRSQYGELGISGKILDNNDVTTEKTLGLDLALFLPGNLSLYGFSSRDLENKGWAEHSYELRIPYQSFRFRPYFGQFDYEHYFGTSTNTVNPFRVLAINGEKLRVIGLDTTWKYSDALDLGVKVKTNDYDRMSSSQYGSGLVTWHGDELTQVGVEVGYMNGDLDRQKYLLSRLFGYFDGLSFLGGGFISADLIWAHYDEPIYGRDNSLFASLGTGHAFFDNAFEVKLSGDYSRDPYFDSDVRGMLALTYRFSNSR